MTVLFGGAYQGKTAYATSAFSLTDADFCRCAETETAPDLTKKAINGIHLLHLALVRAGEDPTAFWQKNRAALADKILLCDDISSGVVPVSAELRAWREANGRALSYLCAEADAVYRLFCGIETKLK